jgi:hypothetical protein
MSFKLEEYVTCVVCGRRFKGTVPKGGDGSILYPRKHRQFSRQTANLIHMYGEIPYCSGSFKEAVSNK